MIKTGNNYIIFCTLSSIDEQKEKYIKDWLWNITEMWNTPTSVKFSGNKACKEFIKDWANSWFGCKFIEIAEDNLNLSDEKISPRSLFSPRGILSNSPRDSSPRKIESPRMRRKSRDMNGKLSSPRRKSSPRVLIKWVEEISESCNVAVIFTETDLGPAIYKHIRCKRIMITLFGDLSNK